MLHPSIKRRVDMILLKPDGTVQVRDTGTFWSEDTLEWRYNFCFSYKKNQESLARLVYGSSEADYSVSETLSSYIEDRKTIQDNIAPYLPIIKEIYNADIPYNVKSSLLQTIDQELHQSYPYKKG